MLHETVSIIVPLHNKGPYISATIESVLSQTCTSWDLIVVENGSVDDGPMVVETFVEREPRIRLLTSPRQGPGTARNFGLEHSSGNWVLFLDADDLLETDHLERLLEIAKQNPLATIIAGGWQEFRDGYADQQTAKQPSGANGIGALRDLAIAASPWAVHAAIVKRELVSRCPWPEEMDGMLAEDNAFWFRLCISGTVAYSESAGALYRTQTANCRTQSHDVEKWFNGVHTAVQKNVAALMEISTQQPNPHQSAALMQLYSILYRQAIEAGNRQIASAAETEATRWLKRTVKLGHLRPTILARSLLGIAWTERLKLLLRTN